MNLEKLRLGLAVALAFTGILLMNAWQAEHRSDSATVTAATPQAEVSPEALPSPVPNLAPVAESALAAQEAPSQGLTPGQRIILASELLEIHVDTRGGEVVEASLIAYPESLEPEAAPVKLMKAEGDQRYHFQAGWMGERHLVGPDTLFTVQQAPTTDANGVASLVLATTTEEGLQFRKRFTLQPGSHVVDVSWQVSNPTDRTVRLQQFTQIQRHWTDDMGDRTSYTGGAWSVPEDRYSRLAFADMRSRPLDVEAPDAWVAMLQHYFVSAVLPPPGQTWSLYSRAASGDRYIIGMRSPVLDLAPAAEGGIELRYYIGPKLQDVLETLAPGLDLTIDYGSLWIFAKPLWWLMSAMHTLTGNWGWAIVLLTVAVKLAFYRLSAASYRSMAHLRRVQPKIQAIRERYKDDNAQLQKAMMDIYREEKINPLGGCLPILVQAPVFFSLYWVLLESVELRQAPFMLWIQDLSAPDPWFILPLVMGATMLLQTRLNPPAADPMQQRMMEIMPIVFTGFTAFFASGLVLYWLVNNVLSISQQWMITRSIAPDPQPPAR
jgi:YidC/Oxa1 family membrane protein insertase